MAKNRSRVEPSEVKIVAFGAGLFATLPLSTDLMLIVLPRIAQDFDTALAGAQGVIAAFTSGLSRPTEKVPEIALELLKDETEREYAPDGLIRQVLRNPGPSDAVDSGLIARNGLDHRIQGRRRSAGWKGQACVPENLGRSPRDP